MTRRAAWLLLVAMLLSACGVVKVKKPPQRAPRGPLTEFTFEAGNPGEEPAGWKVETYSGPGAETLNSKLVLTDKQERSGDMSAELRPNKGTRGGGHGRICGHSPFPGQPLQVSAYIKTLGKEAAFFTVSIVGQNASPFQTLSRPAEKWTKFEQLIIAPEPHTAKGLLELCISFWGPGADPTWIDDVKITKAELPTSPGPKVQPVPLENLDMERFDRRGQLEKWATYSWAGEGTPDSGGELRADRRQKKSGSASLVFTLSEPEGETESGSFGDSAQYCVDPSGILGKTLRVGAWIKADMAEGGVGLFGVTAIPITLEEARGAPERSAGRGESFTASMSILTNVDWTRFEQIAIVSNSAKTFCLSINLNQPGSIWLDDVTVEVIEL